MTVTSPHFCAPKNTGKKDATTASQQAEKEALACWVKKLKRGYCEELSEISRVAFKKPMKGDTWADRREDLVFPVMLQDKLNGVRCQNASAGAWSTGGELFHTIPHIREALSPVFEKHPEALLDGEAFNPLLKRNLNRLIKLVSVAIKPKDLTPELLSASRDLVQLHLFDGFGFNGITEDTPYVERLAALSSLIAELKSPFLEVLKNTQANTEEDVMFELDSNKAEGGEGLMIRWGACPYKHGRSKHLLKLKHFEDAEFVVQELQEGNGDWAGCVKRVILRLHKPVVGRDGEVQSAFASNILGDRKHLKALFDERAKHEGKVATVQYQCLSEYGIPQLPWVQAIRDYESSTKPKARKS
jgi:hypothetical protein